MKLPEDSQPDTVNQKLRSLEKPFTQEESGNPGAIPSNDSEKVENNTETTSASDPKNDTNTVEAESQNEITDSQKENDNLDQPHLDSQKSDTQNLEESTSQKSSDESGSDFDLQGPSEDPNEDLPPLMDADITNQDTVLEEELPSLEDEEADKEKDQSTQTLLGSTPHSPEIKKSSIDVQDDATQEGTTEQPIQQENPSVAESTMQQNQESPELPSNVLSSASKEDSSVQPLQQENVTVVESTTQKDQKISDTLTSDLIDFTSETQKDAQQKIVE